jgi:hypothetical protein
MCVRLDFSPPLSELVGMNGFLLSVKTLESPPPEFRALVRFVDWCLGMRFEPTIW